MLKNWNLSDEGCVAAGAVGPAPADPGGGALALAIGAPPRLRARSLQADPPLAALRGACCRREGPRFFHSRLKDA